VECWHLSLCAHRDPLTCAMVKVSPFYLSTFQARANTQAGWIYLFFSVPVFTTGLVTVICPSPPLFGLFILFSSPWSRDISFFARVYYSCLFSQTVWTSVVESIFSPRTRFCGLLHSLRQGIPRFPQIGVVFLTFKKIVPQNAKMAVWDSGIAQRGDQRQHVSGGANVGIIAQKDHAWFFLARFW